MRVAYVQESMLIWGRKNNFPSNLLGSCLDTCVIKETNKQKTDEEKKTKGSLITCISPFYMGETQES